MNLKETDMFRFYVTHRVSAGSLHWIRSPLSIVLVNMSRLGIHNAACPVSVLLASICNQSDVAILQSEFLHDNTTNCYLGTHANPALCS